MPRSGRWLGGFLAGLVAFLAPGAALLLSATMDVSPGGASITAGEWLNACFTAVVASAVATGAVAGRTHGKDEVTPDPPRSDAA